MNARDKLNNIRKGINKVKVIKKTNTFPIKKPKELKKQKPLKKGTFNASSARRGRGVRKSTQISPIKIKKNISLPKKDNKKFKGIVITYLVGKYDELPRLTKNEGWEYICITNNANLQNKDWKIISIREEDAILNDNKKTASSIMFNIFNYIVKDYEVIITIDANMFINCNLNALVEKVDILNYDAIFLSHPDRNCIYQEIKALLKTSKDTKSNVIKAEKYFLKNNYPKNNGLFATGVIIVNGKSAIVKKYFKEFRKDYINSFSRRDQLTINYSLHKNSKKLSKLNYKTIPFDNIVVYAALAKQNSTIPFICQPHLHKKKIKNFKNTPVNINIYEHTPYNNEKDLVKAYNSFMKLIPNDGWALFRDADTLFLDSHYNELLERAIIDNPDTFCFTGVTNRINNKDQLHDEYKGDDIVIHRRIAMKLRKKYGHSCKEFLPPDYLSGFCILLKKTLWKKLNGFKPWNNKSKILGVDNKLHKDLIAHNEPIKIIKGLYMYHWYRGGTDNILHLL